MKEYSEVYVDPEESLKSFLEKVQEVNSHKVVIIIHQRSSIFIGQVNIELMKKYAEKANKELIFITNIKKIKNLLVGVGFLVYDNLEKFKEDNEITEASQELITMQQSRVPKIKSKGGIFKKIVLFLIVITIIAGGWIYFNLPAITVKVAPTLKTRKVVSNLKANLEQEELDYSNQKLPLIKKEVKIKTKVQARATGEKSIGTKYAKGVVTFINNNKEDVVIPAGTILATRNGIKYKTLSKTVVPKLKVEKLMGVIVGAQAGKEETNIKALYKGESGNVSSGRIVEFANDSYPVKLVNPEATSGGENRLLSQITEDDIKKGLEKTKQRIKEVAKQELAKKFGTELIFFNQQIKLKEPQLKVEDVKAGDLAREFSVVGQIEAIGLAIKKEDLRDLTYNLYNKELGSEFKLYRNKIKIKEVEVTNIKEDFLELNVISTGEIIGDLNQTELIDKILGKKVANVKSLLDNMNEVSNYNISPKNQINLPKFKYGIKLVVVEPTKE